MTHIRESVSSNYVSGPGANPNIRAHPLIILNRGQPTRGVVLFTPSGGSNCVFYVLVTPDRTFRAEGTKRGIDHRIPCWDDDLSIIVCLLSVFRLVIIFSG